MLFLLLLGLITYFIVQRGVASSTTTPVWVLWLVMMTPAFVWTVWMETAPEDQPPPHALTIGLFVICSLLYLYLIQLGRIRSPEESSSASPASEEPEVTPTLPAPALTPDEEKQLQQCFPWSDYALHQTEYRGQVIVCRGQLRAESAKAYHTVQAKIKAVFGDRFLIVFQEGFEGKPFFALIPNSEWNATLSEEGKKREQMQPLIAFGLLLFTLLTATAIGALRFSDLPPELADNSSQLWQNWHLLASGVPYAIALVTILGTHELGHYFMARHYKIKVTLPWFFPFPFFVGTLGAFTQIRSPIPHRRALFDVQISGPLAGLAVTLPVLWWGLSHSEVIAWSEETSLFNINSLNPTATFLLAILSKLALGDRLIFDRALNLHPVAIAGFLGLAITAVSLIPVGQLDGGRVVHAMFGQRTAMVIAQITRLLILVLAFVRQEFLWWAIFLLVIPVGDEPALNDVTELDNGRDLLGLITLAILVMTIVPAPVTLVQWLYG